MIRKFSKNEDLNELYDNKIIAIQGDHPSKLNPLTDTSIFLVNEIQKKNIKFFIITKRYINN